MHAILLVSLVAACGAAPYYNYDHHNHLPHHHSRYEDDTYFDARRFWADLAQDMREMETMINNLYQRFPAISGQRYGIVGNEYLVIIPLNGFQENEVVVKARDGLLMVQAVHKLDQGGERSYIDVKNLPACVDVSGTWVLEKGVLKITFPLKKTGERENVPQPTNPEGPVTESPNLDVGNDQTQERSREEVDPEAVNEKTSADADVGLRGDRDNEFDDAANAVEATTYAVDYKNEVDFVPIRY